MAAQVRQGAGDTWYQTITCEVIAAPRDLFDSRPVAETGFL